jgi:hypothetical protein
MTGSIRALVTVFEGVSTSLRLANDDENVLVVR